MLLRRHSGFSLVEVMLALVIISVVAVVTLRYVHQPSDRVKVNACDLRISQLDVLVRQHTLDHGTLPSRDLRELADTRYLGEPIPVCPVDGRPFRLDRRRGRVVPHRH